jgi:hypothetical protein
MTCQPSFLRWSSYRRKIRSMTSSSAVILTGLSVLCRCMRSCVSIDSRTLIPMISAGQTPAQHSQLIQSRDDRKLLGGFHKSAPVAFFVDRRFVGEWIPKCPVYDIVRASLNPLCDRELFLEFEHLGRRCLTPGQGQRFHGHTHGLRRLRRSTRTRATLRSGPRVDKSSLRVSTS